MKQFNVINYDVNKKKFVSYDIIPYFVDTYNKAKKKPKTISEFKEFVKQESEYQFWSRCEYEIILVDWPSQKHEEKWDIHNQIMMNLEIIAKILMQEIF